MPYSFGICKSLLVPLRVEDHIISLCIYVYIRISQIEHKPIPINDT